MSYTGRWWARSLASVAPGKLDLRNPKHAAELADALATVELDSAEADQPTPKKPYVTPTLKTYGSLTDITKSVGSMSMNADGATMGNTKTS